MSVNQEIQKRRTFAIISHPDAGKTTLTEKFLLFGGAIQTAGAVKSNKIKKSATSDFMEIERQRGISVATSVMNFEYNDTLITLLDTPGHKDFAEDTYRTLSAVDSVILVVDCQKGVEEQTYRLMEVCRMRDTPVIIFVNKMDREGKYPFDLLDELEEKLKIKVRPLSWPISVGSTFKGVYNLFDKSLYAFTPGSDKKPDGVAITNLNDPMIDQLAGQYASQLREDVDLIEGVYGEFDRSTYLSAEVAPVFFGSAINNFGVKEMLDTFIEIAPNPGTRPTDKREVTPTENKFSGFVFKIHANLDPKHRDRIAFLRIVSGKFERNKNYFHVRENRSLKFSNPTAFMAQEKNVVDEAYPGDIVGLFDTGNFKIGDTLSEGEKINFKGIPQFSPELFKYVVNADPMKTKQLNKGLEQLTDEGVAQLFTKRTDNRKILGTVGALQFEVIQHRLKSEYTASCNFENINLYKACWMSCKDKKILEQFIFEKLHHIANDKEGRPVFLAESAWALQMAEEKNPEIKFHFISEFKEG